LLLNANDLFKRVIPFALETGLRLSQIVHLDWKQYDHKNKMLVIPPQKRQKVRRIPLMPKALEVMGRPQFGGSVFHIKDDDQLKKMWARLMRRCGFTNKGKEPRFRFHDLRHTCASRLAKVLSPTELRDFFGWSTVALVDRYTHSRVEDIRAKMQRHYLGSSVGG
jgi:integrase